MAKRKQTKTKRVSKEEFDEFKKWQADQEKQRIENHVPTKYGYARVSTREQKLEAQVEDLKQAGAKKIIQEKYTGTTVKRPAFDKLVHQTLLDGDTLIVTKLDRFARNTAEALETLDLLKKKGVKVNILNVGTFDDSATGKLMFTMFSAFAQFERDLIVTRTMEGKKYAKEHDPDYHEGRPEKFNDAQIELAYSLWKQGNNRSLIQKKTGISISTQKRRFKELEAKQLLENQQKEEA